MVDQIPIFPSTDFDRTEAFWSLLGYGETERFGAEYMIMRHPDGLEQHFFALHRINTKKNFHGAYVRFEDVGAADRLHEEWNETASTEAFTDLAGKAGRVTAIQSTNYGLREFAMLDPDGSLLRIGAPTG